MFVKEANEELDRASSVAGCMQRSATGATCDADGLDATSERLQQLRMRRRTDIDTMFELPDICLNDEDIDWVSSASACDAASLEMHGNWE